jgi:hypothetical protein
VTAGEILRYLQQGFERSAIAKMLKCSIATINKRLGQSGKDLVRGKTGAKKKKSI